jgi:hypothetical protein
MNLPYLALGLAIGIAVGLFSGELVACIPSGLVLGYAIGEARKKKGGRAKRRAPNPIPAGAVCTLGGAAATHCGGSAGAASLSAPGGASGDAQQDRLL